MADRSRLELRHLRYFREVVDELHFGHAAARLFVTQPTLSVQIRQLEEEVGARLFDRHTRQVTLTDAGRVLDEAARRILRSVDVAVENTRQTQAGRAGVLRLGFGTTFMLSSLAQTIRHYRQRYPAVRVDLRELSAGEQLSALLSGDLDVGFVRGAEPDSRLQAELFAREPLVIALPPDHPKARLERVPLSSLANDSWVLFPRTISPTLHERVMHLCAQAGFRPNVVQESREVDTTVGLVGAGVGVTIVPDTARQITWKGIVYKAIPRAWMPIEIVRPTGPVKPVVDTFLSLARKPPARDR
jgi:DNA-binding transcriptional LysR family regulator